MIKYIQNQERGRPSMLDTIQKLEYHVRANIPGAKDELHRRLTDRVKLPLCGLNGESLYLTGMSELRNKVSKLDTFYAQLPAHRGVKDTILLDAWSSATIEGARTTVQQVRDHFKNPKTKDDRMVINTIAGTNYAYNRPITERNIRTLWEKVVEGVCDNEAHRGTLYRDGMVYIGSGTRIVHTPARAEQLPELMDQWFSFREEETGDLLIRSFVSHFYFVYLHPFCDGNGRTARILNASQLYHGGYKKMKSLPLSSAINKQLSGYYSSLEDSEIVLNGTESKWLDLTPFVSYMLDAFERCMMDAALSENVLSEKESKLLERMNKAGIHGEITVKKAAAILRLSENGTRSVLEKLVKKGYLTVNKDKVPYIYRFEQHISYP